jgi:hypothetical protein
MQVEGESNQPNCIMSRSPPTPESRKKVVFRVFGLQAPREVPSRMGVYRRGEEMQRQRMELERLRALYILVWPQQPNGGCRRGSSGDGSVG